MAFQIIETTRRPDGMWVWETGFRDRLSTGVDRSGRRTIVAPRNSKQEAEIDELMAKGILGQDKLVRFLKNKFIPEYERTGEPAPRLRLAPGGVKRRSEVEKKVRAKGSREAMDISRATLEFDTVDQVLHAMEFLKSYEVVRRYLMHWPYEGRNWALTNRYNQGIETGEYQDVKYFLAFKIHPASPYWTAELQLNTFSALRYKETYSHPIYEVIRLWNGKNVIITLDKPSRDKCLRHIRTLSSRLHRIESSYPEARRLRTKLLNQIFRKLSGLPIQSRTLPLTRSTSSSSVRAAPLRRETSSPTLISDARNSPTLMSDSWKLDLKDYELIKEIDKLLWRAFQSGSPNRKALVGGSLTSVAKADTLGQRHRSRG